MLGTPETPALGRGLTAIADGERRGGSLPQLKKVPRLATPGPGHRELDLAFMGKGAPHVGFPEAVLAKYAEKLVSLGYKVRPAGRQ